LENTTDWTKARWELEPLTALANLWDETSHPQASWLLNQAGQRWFGLAEWGQCEPLMRRALEIDEKSYGPDHPKWPPTSTTSLGCSGPPTGWPRPSR
jgi:hypothetical protein